jgi:membrane protease YdiL (CAAX protease family)
MEQAKLWKFFIATACLQLLGSWLYFVVLDNAIAIQIGYFLTKALMLTAPLALLYFGFSIPKFTLRPEPKLSLALGLSTGLMIAGLILGVYFIFPQHFNQFSPIITAKITEIGILKFYWPVVIVISLLHSLFEEYYIRWYVVGGLSTKLTPVRAILIGNIIFTIHHYIILSQFVSWPLVIFLGTFVGIGGCIWSYIYHRTGSLLGAWISHACADIAVFIAAYFLIQ